MSDYSFMKSGFNNVNTNDDDNVDNIISILLHFMTNATKSASIYVKHANRNAITPEDIKRALMLEMFLFNKRENVLEEVEKIKEEIKHFEEDEEENTMGFCPENEVQNFKESTCQCPMCKCLNTIYDRWNKWTPQSKMECIIHKHIENM